MVKRSAAMRNRCFFTKSHAGALLMHQAQDGSTDTGSTDSRHWSGPATVGLLRWGESTPTAASGNRA